MDTDKSHFYLSLARQVRKTPSFDPTILTQALILTDESKHIPIFASDTDSLTWCGYSKTDTTLGFAPLAPSSEFHEGQTSATTFWLRDGKPYCCQVTSECSWRVSQLHTEHAVPVVCDISRAYDKLVKCGEWETANIVNVDALDKIDRAIIAVTTFIATPDICRTNKSAWIIRDVRWAMGHMCKAQVPQTLDSRILAISGTDLMTSDAFCPTLMELRSRFFTMVNVNTL